MLCAMRVARVGLFDVTDDRAGFCDFVRDTEPKVPGICGYEDLIA